MSKAHALPTGLGIESEGLELSEDELPEWEESKIKTYPIVRIDIDSGKVVPLTCGSVGRTQ